MRAQSLLALACSLFAASLFAGETLRFSQSLTPEQRTTAGIDRLNSDQVAALDALVRIDARKSAAATKKAEASAAASTKPAPTRSPFSQGLSTEQRRAAGLDSLTPEQQQTVNTLVDAQVGHATTRHELASTTTVEAVEFFPNRFEVHGQFGFSLGVGSGGYSSREAWLSTSLLDTKTGTEFSVGISSGREKWKGPYRHYRDYRHDWDDVSFGLSAPLFRSR